MATILLIDDDEDIRQIVNLRLEETGHIVRHAENGREGLEKAQAAPPDLIILDLDMPVMDGTRVIKALRAHPGTQAVPVIALSAVSIPEMRDDMHRLGCDAYVTKPINFNTLIGNVLSLLKG